MTLIGHLNQATSEYDQTDYRTWVRCWALVFFRDVHVGKGLLDKLGLDYLCHVSAFFNRFSLFSLLWTLDGFSGVMLGTLFSPFLV